MGRALSVGVVTMLLLLLMASEPATGQVTASHLWKARALEAADNLRGLQKKLDTLRSRWDSEEANETKCEAMLESAYALHITQESTVHKVTPGGHHAFKIILSGGDKGMFDLTYLYDPGTWRLSSGKILALPRDWELFLPVGEMRELGGAILVITKEASVPFCSVAFSLDDPFLAHVIRSEKQSPTHKQK